MNKRYIKLTYLFLALTLAGACTESELEVFKGDKGGIYFSIKDEDRSAKNNYIDSTRFSFAEISESIATIKLPISVLGEMMNFEREVEFEVIADSTTAKEGLHYEFVTDKLMLQPGAVHVDIPIKLTRDTSLLRNDYVIYFRLKTNEWFTPEPLVELYDPIQNKSIKLNEHKLVITGKVTPPPVSIWGLPDVFGEYSDKKYLLINELCKLTLDDWLASVPPQRSGYWAVIRNYLQKQYDAGTPIYEDRLDENGNKELMRVKGLTF